MCFQCELNAFGSFLQHGKLRSRIKCLVRVPLAFIMKGLFGGLSQVAGGVGVTQCQHNPLGLETKPDQYFSITGRPQALISNIEPLIQGVAKLAG